LNLTYGKRGAVIEGQYPPAMYGSSEIGQQAFPPSRCRRRRSADTSSSCQPQSDREASRRV
jgi:hypothetical protein